MEYHGNCQQPKGLSMFYTLHADAGHDWLEVPLADCQALGLNATNFSRHSYRWNDTLYLECDCDMPLFMDAYHKANGIVPELELQTSEYSPIRKMERVR